MPTSKVTVEPAQTRPGPGLNVGTPAPLVSYIGQAGFPKHEVGTATVCVLFAQKVLLVLITTW